MFPLSLWLGRDDEGVLSRALLAISHNLMCGFHAVGSIVLWTDTSQPVSVSRTGLYFLREILNSHCLFISIAHVLEPAGLSGFVLADY